MKGEAVQTVPKLRYLTTNAVDILEDEYLNYTKAETWNLA